MKTIEISVLAAASIMDYVNGEISAASPFYLEAIREIRDQLEKLKGKGN